jgi:hypothetical protein
VAIKLVSLIDPIVTTGVLGGEIKVVIGVAAESVEPVVFVPVTTKVYSVRLIRPLKVAVVPLTEGVVATATVPFLSKYVKEVAVEI